MGCPPCGQAIFTPRSVPGVKGVFIRKVFRMLIHLGTETESKVESNVELNQLGTQSARERS
jgi:hypothetical protein